ncbi:hypothetical protein [Leyella stercorea]|uniref:hypothetical protein n=1 Tax=Leyella stercorea TaxID=363265 RepID=UPI0024305339|nr:hypothetical protein [Leyella stercorea]
MAIVNVDYSEFETLKNRVKELEETVKEKDKTIASLKDGSRVIIRKEVQIEYWSYSETCRRMRGIDKDHLYSQDDKPRRTVETSESYLGFEDVRMKDEVNRSIQQRDESRASYESSVQRYNEKEKKLDDKEKSLKDKYAQKEADLISEYKEKGKALEADYLAKGKAYKQQLDADYKIYMKKAGRLPSINQSAKEALSLLNANRFFKPKGVESILAKIIQKCED